MQRLILLVLALVLLGCGGDDLFQEEPLHCGGVVVTADVPCVVESIADIVARGEPPPQGDRVAPDHTIYRGGR